MALIRQTIPNAQRLTAKINAVLGDLGEAAQGAILFLSSYKEVVRAKKNLALNNMAFGLQITTLSSWVCQRWDLYGDGRGIISQTKRELLMYRAFFDLKAKKNISVLSETPGTITMACAIAQECFSVLADKNFSLEQADIFTETEKEIVTILARYHALLDTYNLCEQSQALTMMMKKNVQLTVPLIFAGENCFTQAEQDFIEYASQHVTVMIFDEGIALPAKSKNRSKELVEIQSCLFDPDPKNPIKPTGALSFLLPSGRYALPRVLMQAINECVLEHDRRIALSSCNPQILFENMSPCLVKQGIASSLTTLKPFIQTEFGKAWVALLDFILGETCSTFQLSDVIISAFSGIELSKAYRMDARWRSDRTSHKENCIKDVSEESLHLAKVIAHIKAGDLLEALTVFEGWIKTRFMWNECFRSEQLSTLSVAREVAQGCKDFHLDSVHALPLFSHKNVQIRAYATAENPLAPLVEFMGMEALAQEEVCSFDTAIICDMDAISYPVKEDDDAKTRFLAKLKLVSQNDALSQARRIFYKALSTMNRKLICQRVLYDTDANESYPSVMFEELVDCYRSDLTSMTDLDKKTGLARVLVPFVVVAGEAELFENLRIQNHVQEVEAIEILPEEGCISDLSRKKIALPHRLCTQSSEGILCLSPSAIESYVECPYKWFALRRLRLERIDAGFGPLEMGSFAHGVLKSSYLHFQESEGLKVTEATLDKAKKLFSHIFDQQLTLQPQIRKNDNPLIALSALEEAEIDALKKKMMRYLDREAVLLPGFVPRYFEFNFGDKTPFSYAGCTLHGSVDRIDVNEKGQAVIIDYKGSVSSEYAFHTTSEVPWVHDAAEEKPLNLPHKLQALMYAQAIRKTLNLEVVGAFYVSYGGDAQISGAYDPIVFAPHDLLDIDSDLCAYIKNEKENFSEVLDCVETSVEKVVARLSEGYIKPYPRGKDPCGYCPVTACKKRKRV